MLLQDPELRGSFATLKSLDEARVNVLLTAEELTEFNYKQGEDQEGNEISKDALTWNEKGSEEREVEMNELAVKSIAEKLKSLDEKEDLSRDQITLYEKFVETTKED